MSSQVWTGSQIKCQPGCFHTLSLSQFLRAVEDFHERVSVGSGRVEITRDDCGEACVLISKSELDALERAIEILAQSDDYRANVFRIDDDGGGMHVGTMPCALCSGNLMALSADGIIRAWLQSSPD